MNDTVSTVIESYIVVTTLNLSPLGDNAITSDSDIELLGQKGGVTGLVEYVGELTCPGDPGCEEVKRDLCGRMWRFARDEDDTAINPYITVGLAPYGPAEAFR